MLRRHRIPPISILLSLLLALGSFFGFSSVARGDQPSPAIASSVTGASVTLPSNAVVLRVDGSVPETAYYPHTGVWPDGSEATPYPSIAWAVSGAQWLRQRGTPAHIVIRPGVYRENIDIGWAGDAAPPLVIEPEIPGTVTVSGADVESRWTPVSGTSYFTAPWGSQWGLALLPDGWAGVIVPDLVRRREAVLFDGQPLTQVGSVAALQPGTFTVNETAGQILMQPPAGAASPDGHLVEVAKRETALRIRGLARSVLVRNLVFEGAAAPFERYMAYVTDATNILLEGNTFRHSSWGGLGLSTGTDVTIRNNVSRDNGGNGIDTNRSRNVVIEGNLITGNNTRGFNNGFVGWSTAGSKNLRLHDAIFRGNVYEANYARGLWLDTDVSNVLIDGDRSTGNVGDGIFIERVQGPVEIQGATFSGNTRAGILVGTSKNVTVQGSTLAENAYGQLVFAGERYYTGLDFLTGLLFEMKDFEAWTLRDNVFASSGSAPLIYSPVVPIAEWRAMLADGEIVASGNLWRRPTEHMAIKIQASSYSFAEWRAATGDSAVFDDMSEPEPQPEPEPTTTTTEPEPTPTTEVEQEPTTTTEPQPTTSTTAPAKGNGNGPGANSGGNGGGNNGNGGGKGNIGGGAKKADAKLASSSELTTTELATTNLTTTDLTSTELTTTVITTTVVKATGASGNDPAAKAGKRGS